MELDYIVYIDIVRICVVILPLLRCRPGALSAALSAAPAPPPSCTEGGGAETPRHSSVSMEETATAAEHAKEDLVSKRKRSAVFPLHSFRSGS